MELVTVHVALTSTGQLLPGLVTLPGPLITDSLRRSLDTRRDWVLATSAPWVPPTGGRCPLGGTTQFCSGVGAQTPPRTCDRSAAEAYLAQVV